MNLTTKSDGDTVTFVISENWLQAKIIHKMEFLNMVELINNHIVANINILN